MSKMDPRYKDSMASSNLNLLLPYTLLYHFLWHSCSHIIRCLRRAPCQELCGTFVFLLHCLFFPSWRSFYLMISLATRKIRVQKDAVLNCQMFVATAQIIVHLPTASLQLVQMGLAPNWLTAILVSTQAGETNGVWAVPGWTMFCNAIEISNIPNDLIQVPNMPNPIIALWMSAAASMVSVEQPQTFVATPLLLSQYAMEPRQRRRLSRTMRVGTLNVPVTPCHLRTSQLAATHTSISLFCTLTLIFTQ